MMAQESENVLLRLGNLAMKNSKWADYANYCFDRAKGLRKSALKHIDRFCESTSTWTLDDKIDFVKFVLPIDEQDTNSKLLPFSLLEHLIRPTLVSWCDIEQVDNNPFRWLGLYYGGSLMYNASVDKPYEPREKNLLKAIELDPTDDLARVGLIEPWAEHIWFAVHHLPEYYIGNPPDDIKTCEKINEQIQQLTKPELREYWTGRVERSQELVRNYFEWKVSQHPDFKQWGQENNKETNSYVPTYYYHQR